MPCFYVVKVHIKIKGTAFKDSIKNIVWVGTVAITLSVICLSFDTIERIKY